MPLWLAPASATHYQVTEYTVAGAETLLRVLTGQPLEIEPALGAVPVLPPRGARHRPAGRRRGRRCAPQVVIEAALAEDGQVASAVWLARVAAVPAAGAAAAEVAGVWGALGLPALVAGGADGGGGAAAGRGCCWIEAAQEVLAGLVDRLPPGDTVEVVLSAAGAALALPVELIRLARRRAGRSGRWGCWPG